MNPTLVNRRLSLIGTSSGSVVSVATWCALHAQDADVVVGCLTARLAAPTTPDVLRASLLYVLHELLLTCASRGTSDGAKRAVLTAVARTLPAALGRVWQVARTPSIAGNSGNSSTSEVSAVSAALGKVVVWWAMLKLFPRQWLDELRHDHRRAMEEACLPQGVPATLQRALPLVGRYQDAKMQWLRAKAAAGNAADAASAEESARRALAVLRKAVEGRLEGGRSLTAWCAAQQAELEGQQPASMEGALKRERAEPPLSVVKTEDTVTASGAVAEDDDILGSFY